jgi:GxxExxY protein
LKAVTEVEPRFYIQIINYLKIFKIEIGLLINFGNTSLQYRRFANSR